MRGVRKGSIANFNCHDGAERNPQGATGLRVHGEEWRSHGSARPTGLGRALTDRAVKFRPTLVANSIGSPIRYSGTVDFFKRATGSSIVLIPTSLKRQRLT